MTDKVCSQCGAGHGAPGTRCKRHAKFIEYSPYAALDVAARRIANDVAQQINDTASYTECEAMPYKAQYILEEVIKMLEARV